MKSLSLADRSSGKADAGAPEASTLVPPSPAPMPRSKAKGKGRTWRNVFERVLLPLILGGAVYLVWWGLERLRKVQQQSASLSQQVSRLSTEMELMQGQWPSNKVDDVSQQFADAESLVFRGSPAVTRWGEQVTREALRRALDVQVRFTSTRSSQPGEKAFTILRARLEIRPAAGVESPHTPFQRLLDFADNLVTQTQRVDLLEVRVVGASNSVRRAEAIVELWGVETPDGEVIAQLDTSASPLP